MLVRPTSTHGPILPQGVAGWAGAQVGALGIVATEGTEQRVQGAFVDVWGGQWRCQLWGAVGRTSTPSPRHLHHTAQVLGKQSRTLTGHHGARLKAVSTGTFEASDDIGACALPTGVADRALVCV